MLALPFLGWAQKPQAPLPTLAEYVQTHQLAPQKAEGNVFYIMEREGTGATPKTGDYVKVAFKGSLLNGHVFDQAGNDTPFFFQVGQGQSIRGWDLGIRLFKAGGKGVLLLPAEIAYGRNGVGTAIPPNASIRLDVELLGILSESEYDHYITAEEQKAQRAFEQRQNEQFTKDKKDIFYYCAEKGLKAKTLHSGLSYVVEKKGKGKNALPGDVLTVAYEGYLLDGRRFDQSEQGKSFQFELGAKKVIQAWEEGLQLFNEHSEGWLLAPSKLAYGPLGIKEGKVDIPANSVLVFKVKVEKITRKKLPKK